jgi:4'-phosphopantetheinyl transferase
MSVKLPSGGDNLPGTARLDRPTIAPAALGWPLPPPEVRLANRQADLWCATMPSFAEPISLLSALLSAEERQRAERFHFSVDRDRYIVRRGILRILLSRYLNTQPAEIEFRYGRWGKPEMKGNALDLHFNDSHSGDLALYAVTAAGPIGADIEQVRPIPEFEDLASRYFSPRESALIRALVPERRMEAFYSVWTRKEAFLKATGEGIGRNLAEIEVSPDPGQEPAILRVPGSTPGPGGWKLRSFSPAAGYLGAVAFQGDISSFREFVVPVSFISHFAR